MKAGYPMPYYAGELSRFDSSDDKLIFGFDSQVDGLWVLPFESTLDSSSDEIYIEFFDSSGAVSATLNTAALNDGTEFFAHVGTLSWDLSGITWEQCTINAIKTANEISAHDVTDDELNISRYYLAIRIPTLDTTGNSLQIDLVRTLPDSLAYIGEKLSDGSSPIWYLKIPEDLRSIAPSYSRRYLWLPIKITQIAFELASPSRISWNVEIQFTVPTPDEVPDSHVYSGVSV